MNRRLPLLFILLALPLLMGSLIFTNQLHAGTADICLSGCTYVSIQDAASNGPENTPLTIAAGVYTENVSVSRSVILVGAGSGQTIIDGDAADSVVMVSGAVTVSISGVTLRNGDASLDGGGLLNEGGTVTLSDSVVENNIAPNGAGILNDGTMILDDVTVHNNTADELVGSVSICSDCAGGGILNLSVMTMTNSTIHGNTADFGGGIDNATFANLTATNITVYDNTAENTVSQGGGIENLGVMSLIGSDVHTNSARNGAGIFNEGTLTVSSSDIHANVASGRGGGFHNTFNLTVQTSNIYDNQAGSGGGGGISTESGAVVLDRSAVYNNSATGSGGGIVNNVEPVSGTNSFTITNSTISGNSTAGQGGGLRSAGSAVTNLTNVTFSNNTSTVVNGQSISILAGTVTAKNTIIAISGSGTNCSGTVSSQGRNIVSDNTCQLSGTGDLSNTNPRLGALQNNGGPTLTHALLLGSPAIDSGSGCPAVDQRGVARPFGPACDRGAYEYNQVVQRVYLPFVVRQ